MPCCVGMGLVKRKICFVLASFRWMEPILACIFYSSCPKITLVLNLNIYLFSFVGGLLYVIVKLEFYNWNFI